MLRPFIQNLTAEFFCQRRRFLRIDVADRFSRFIESAGRPVRRFVKGIFGHSRTSV